MGQNGQGEGCPPLGGTDRKGADLNTGATWQIRPLGQKDLPGYRSLRLAALRDHPEAFGADYEESLEADLAFLIGIPPSVTLGAFAGESLIGIAGLAVSRGAKRRHKGEVWGVYVAPEWRGKGAAKALIDTLIRHAESIGLSVLHLSVTAGNDVALALYHAAGFRIYGTEPHALCIDGVYRDENLMALLLEKPAEEPDVQRS